MYESCRLRDEMCRGDSLSHDVCVIGVAWDAPEIDCLFADVVNQVVVPDVDMLA